MKRVVVTGGAGFIGSHIVDTLLEANSEVHVIDDLSTGVRENVPKNATLHEMDIRSSECADFLREFAPDTIVHAAAQISVRVSMENPQLDTSINVGGLVNLLHAVSSSNSVRPFVVMLSTGGAIYGEQERFPAEEDHPIRPTSVYGLAKRVSELYLDLWERQYGVPFCALRLANVYGPRQNPHGEAGVVAIFCERMLRGDEVVINGTGTQTRDFVFVKDVARAVGLVAAGRTGGTFNIGTARESSVLQLYEVLAQTLGVTRSARHGPAKHGEQLRSCIDPARARRVLGWQPSVALEEGLAETAEWFKRNAT